jgi:hypothetical protein
MSAAIVGGLIGFVLGVVASACVAGWLLLRAGNFSFGK